MKKAIFLIFLIFMSCNNDDDTINNSNAIISPVESPMYSNGVFITRYNNLGNFGDTHFLSFDTNIVEEVYKNNNNNTYGIEDSERFYYVMNHEGNNNTQSSIEILDKNTFQQLSIIDNSIKNPIKVIEYSNRIYIINQGENFLPFIAVFNFDGTNASFVNSIELKPQTSIVDVYHYNNKLYITEGGTNFSVEKVVKEFNMDDNSITDLALPDNYKPQSVNIHDNNIIIHGRFGVFFFPKMHKVFKLNDDSSIEDYTSDLSTPVFSGLSVKMSVYNDNLWMYNNNVSIYKKRPELFAFELSYEMSKDIISDSMYMLSEDTYLAKKMDNTLIYINYISGEEINLGLTNDNFKINVVN